MTAEKAIDFLKEEACKKCTKKNACVDCAIQMSMRALEKQVPKELEDGEASIICPSCKKRWSISRNDTYNFDYCPGCGQRFVR